VLLQAAYVVRFLYYSQLQNPWWVLPIEVLHGLTFGVMWSAVTHFSHEIAPAGLHSTVQGIVNGLHWGLGVGSGAVCGGILYQNYGAVFTFKCGAVLSTVSLALIGAAIAHSAVAARKKAVQYAFTAVEPSESDTPETELTALVVDTHSGSSTSSAASSACGSAASSPYSVRSVLREAAELGPAVEVWPEQLTTV
jgi:MFS family permease